MIFLTLILAAFLRLFRLEPNLVFHGELGDNYFVIKQIVESGQIPLLGPPTSHPWLSFGPLFYYLMAPIMKLNNFDPVAGSYFIAYTQILLVAVNLFFMWKLFGKRVSLISTFLISISPLFLNLARQSRFFSLVTLFFYPFFYFLVGGNLILSGLFFGIMINFHLTPVVFIPPLIIYLIRKRSKWTEYFKFLLGIAIPNIPFLIYNINNNFEMLKNLTLWFPYRVAGFVGVLPKNSPTSVAIVNNFYSLSSFMSSSFIYRPLFGWVFIVIILLYIVIQFKKNWKAREISHEFLLVLFFIFGYAGIFIHGNPPSHYYLPLFSIPIIFFSIFLSRIKSKKIIGLILILICLLNFKFFFSERWFYRDTSQIYENREVPYQIQLDAAGSIIRDADGSSYSIKRVGEFDYFDENYSQNYKHLLSIRGNTPIKISELIYTIYEGKTPEPGEIIIFEKGGVIVTKNQ